jgi:hypothetical protein
MADRIATYTFNEDYGLGLCLQCMGEFKASNQTGKYPSFACTGAPCPVGIIPVCYEHITVTMPSTLQRATGPIPDLIGVDQSRGGIPIPSTATNQHRRTR